jgi:hypothetical protein
MDRNVKLQSCEAQSNVRYFKSFRNLSCQKHLVSYKLDQFVEIRQYSMVLAQVSPLTSRHSASMFFVIGLVHLLCLSPLIGSASIKLLDSPDHSIDSTREGHVQAVKSAAHISRRSDTGLSPSVANSGCYSYLKEKDGCAYANPTNNCARKMSSMAVQLVSDSI